MGHRMSQMELAEKLETMAEILKVKIKDMYEDMP